MVRTLELIFSHAFDGKIWNMVSEPSGRFLLVEVRKQEEFLAAFYLYDRESKTLARQPVNLEENWWVGVSYFYADLIVFHVFPDADNPAIKDFFCYSIPEARILWTKSAVNITSFTPNGFTILSEDEKEILYHDLFSGDRTEEKIGPKVPSDTNFIGHPFHYEQGSDYFETTKRFLASLGIEGVERGIDYYENQGVVILAYYIGGTKLVNDLLVIDLNKNILLQERLGSDLNGISDWSFFIFNNELIFVRNSTDLLSYQLHAE